MARRAVAPAQVGATFGYEATRGGQRGTPPNRVPTNEHTERSPWAPARSRIMAIVLPREIETRRLTLRPFVAADLEDVLSYARDPQWGRYLPVSQPYTRQDAEEYIATHEDRDWSREPVWAMERDGRVIGGIDLHVDDAYRAWIGYSTAPTVWGQGFATEAATAIIDTAFVSIGSLMRLYAACDVQNVASARVMERAGMSREGVLRQHGVLRGQTYDELVCSILRDEWAAARR